MSDYFGALMNLSGLGDRARGPVAPANAPDAGGDIVESEVVREAVATPAPAAQPYRACADGAADHAAGARQPSVRQPRVRRAIFRCRRRPRRTCGLPSRLRRGG